jgi:hypothetical protein
MARIVDWDYWRHQFVTGDMSLKELSEGHTAPAFKTLRNKSSAEDWPSQRQKFRDMKRTQAAILPDVKQTADEVKKIIDSAEMLTRHAQLTKLMGAIAAHELQQLRRKQLAGEPTGLKPDDALKLARAAIADERLTEGLATQRQELDLSSMSDAELEKLANGR